MIKKCFLIILLLCFSLTNISAQYSKEPLTTRPSAPLMIKNLFIFKPDISGWQVGVGKQITHITKHKLKRSGKEKIVIKDRIVWSSIGFYNHKNLHTNIFLTVGQSFTKNYRYNFYREFIPCIGISRTFINNTVYTVDEYGNVKQRRAGDWRIASGVSSGIGKKLNPEKTIIRDVYIRLLCRTHVRRHRATDCGAA